MEILQEVLDNLRDDVVRLLMLVLAFVRQVGFGITCRYSVLQLVFNGTHSNIFIFRPFLLRHPKIKYYNLIRAKG